MPLHVFLLRYPPSLTHTQQITPSTLCQNELWTQHKVLCLIREWSNCPLYSDTPSYESKGLWFSVKTKQAPQGYSCFLSGVCKCVVELCFHGNLIYTHHRPLTSSCIIQTNGGLSFTMWPPWFHFPPRGQSVTHSGSVMIGDTQPDKAVSQRSCTLTCWVSAFCSQRVT